MGLGGVGRGGGLKITFTTIKPAEFFHFLPDYNRPFDPANSPPLPVAAECCDVAELLHGRCGGFVDD